MLHSKQLDCGRVEELKNHPPIASDAKRKKSGKFLRKALSVQERMERIFFQNFNEFDEFGLLGFRKPLC